MEKGKLFVYDILEVGSRGEVVKRSKRRSDLDIEDFCSSVYESYIIDLMDGLDEEERGEVGKSLEEFGGVFEMEEGWEIWFNDEECMLVKKVGEELEV